jgi:small subunit ribosomal protein S20
MPIIKSAKKRVRVSEKATIRNSKTKRILRESVKSLKKAITGGNPKDIENAHKKAISAIDVAEKKNVIHKNKASRKKSQLSKAVKSTGTKTTAKKTTATSAPKKTTVKKVATKKPTTVKKVATKKPVKAKE